jgi:hypothetical protein
MPKLDSSTDSNVLGEAVSELDTLLKAACYDTCISSKNGKAAIAAVERVRRKMKAMEGRAKSLSKIQKNENASSGGE